MIALLALHAIVGGGTVAFAGRLGRRALLVGAVPPLAATIWLLVSAGRVLDGEVIVEQVAWVPALDIVIDLRLDGIGALMALLVSGIGVAVFAYSLGYFRQGSARLGRLAGLLTLFAGSMLGLVLADNLLVLYTCWELTSVTSYLLIAHNHTDANARAAALHALLVTVAGGLAMLGGFVVLGQAAGTYRLSEILAAPPGGRAVTIALVLVLLGAFTKSAQVPFHGWLPGAMAAPTPVSAYLHSATMVKAGVYLVARLAPAFAVVSMWQPTVVVVGLVTMVVGGLRALRQHDLKLLLAFGTVSQLGLLMVVFGLGTPEADEAGCILLLAHAAFKAALFMVVGTIDHETGTRDLRELPVLGRGWGTTKAVLIASAASMAGLPLVAGFIAKEAVYAGVIDAGPSWSAAALAGLVAGSALTVAYSARMVWGVLVAPTRRERPAARTDRSAIAETATSPGWLLVGPGLALTAVTLEVGLLPSSIDRLVEAAASSLNDSVHGTHLEIWHGFGLPLALSALTIVVGAALFAGRSRLDAWLEVGERLPDSREAYLTCLRWLNRFADRVTGVVQNGSLPIYTGVILLTAAVLPLWVLLRGDGPSRVVWDANPAQLLVSVVLVGSALAAAAIRRRLSAVLFLGVTGYGMAALFVLRGAPDLALTQVAIETLSTVLFVLVLRKLPDRFERKSLRSLRVVRFAIAAVVASGVFVLALHSGASPPEEPVSAEMVERAYPDGHGRNVVNVILVDFRGLDTLGEITVLAAAAIGAVALARAGRRPPRTGGGRDAAAAAGSPP